MCDGVSEDFKTSGTARFRHHLLDDHRFHALLPDADWGRLPVAIWRRFSKRLADGKTVVYVGEVDEASFSRDRLVGRADGAPDRRAAADRLPTPACR